MPTVPLSRGRVTRLDVHHFASGVRIIAHAGDDVAARIVLSPEERDRLVRILSSPDPTDATFEELFAAGHFEATGRWAARHFGDIEDRMQDAACVVWLRVQRRRAWGKPTTLGLMRTMYRRTLVSCRDRFVAGGRPRSDALGALRPWEFLGDDALQLAGAADASAETRAELRIILDRLPAESRELVVRRCAGDTLTELSEETGIPRATLHRRERQALRCCRAE